MIKSHFCKTREEVVRYLNEQKVTRENVINIVWIDYQKGFAVFYWSAEQLNG